MTDTLDARARSDRSPGVSYHDLVAQDTGLVPGFLKVETNPDFGVEDIPARFYYSRDIQELENERIWKRTWQFVCREERIPDVGDTFVFELAGVSVLVVRSAPGQIKAFYNACLHRGRVLREFSGPTRDLQCSFHGFCWNLDGSLKRVPAAWDFPQVQPERFGLPGMAVGTWGGFVFVNLDPEAEPLHNYLGVLPEQLDHWDFEGRYTEVEVSKVLPCNWKVAQEAFMESFHIVTTHPQLLQGVGDANSQYDTWGNVSRAITPRGTPSPHLTVQPTEQEIFDAMMGLGLDDAPVFTLPDDARARAVIAAATRKKMAGQLGDRSATLSDTECVDSFYYTLFPNFHPWGSYNRICYRFRPNGDDPETSIMDVLMLSPFTGERPPPAPIRSLGLDESFVDVQELGILARVFFQDEYNVGFVQKGLHTLTENKPGVTFGRYQETKIRHFYHLYRQRLGV